MRGLFVDSLVEGGVPLAEAQRRIWTVDSKGLVDLKAWTLDQIFEEAQRAYEEVWRHRDQLSAFPNAKLSEYLELNDYPEEFRSNLRDALSYLRAELLANTT